MVAGMAAVSVVVYGWIVVAGAIAVGVDGGVIITGVFVVAVVVTASVGGGVTMLADLALTAVLTLCGPQHLELVGPVRLEAHRYRLRPAVLAAVARVETRCDSHKVGARGERGAWQVLPEGSANRARHPIPDDVLARPGVNARYAARHLRRLLNLCGSYTAALSLYSANRRRCSREPTEYSAKVLEFAKQAERPVRS